MASRQIILWEMEMAALRWSREKFVRGVDDCALALADIVHAVTGRDAAVEFRSRYSTRSGAWRIARRAGGMGPLLDQLAHREGWIEITPRQARVGDIGLTQGVKGPGGVVMKYRRGWIGRPETVAGIAIVKNSQVQKAWRIKWHIASAGLANQ